MNREAARELLIPYLDGEVSGDRRRELEAAVANDRLLERELAQLRELTKTMCAKPTETVDDTLRAGFRDLLEREKARVASVAGESSAASPSRWSLRSWPGWSAAVAVLVLGVFLGIRFVGPDQPADVGGSTVQPLLAAYTENEGVSSRLQWLDHVSGTTEPEAVAVLLEIAANEDNASLRAAAVDALNGARDVSTVRQRLIELLQNEWNPVVQIVLLEAMGDASAAEVRVSMERLLVRRDVHPAVKGLAQKELMQL